MPLTVRTQSALALALTLALGVLSRVIETGFNVFDKYLGDALYTAAIFWLLRLLAPQQTPARMALISFALSLAVEIFQLTGIPLALRDSPALALRIVSVALGTMFSGWDILAYAVGALLCGVIARVKTKQES